MKKSNKIFAHILSAFLTMALVLTATPSIAVAQGNVSPVPQVSSTSISTVSALQTAINNVAENGTITLNSNITGSDEIALVTVSHDRSFSLNLNGYTIKNTRSNNGKAFSIKGTSSSGRSIVHTGKGTLSLIDTSSQKNGTVVSIDVLNDAALSVNKGNVTAINAKNHAKITVDDGNITAIKAKDNVKVTVLDGDVTSIDATNDAQITVSDSDVTSINADNNVQVTVSDSDVTSIKISDKVKAIISDCDLTSILASDDSVVSVAESDVTSIKTSNNVKATVSQCEVISIDMSRSIMDISYCDIVNIQASSGSKLNILSGTINSVAGHNYSVSITGGNVKKILGADSIKNGTLDSAVNVYRATIESRETPIIINYQLSESDEHGSDKWYVWLPEGSATATVGGRTYTAMVTTDNKAVFQLSDGRAPISKTTPKRTLFPKIKVKD